MTGEALRSDVALSGLGLRATFDVSAFEDFKVPKWCESTLLEDVALGPFGQFRHFQRKSVFFFGLCEVEKCVLENSGKHALDHFSGSFRI